MTENQENLNKSGWFERKDSLLGIAKRHHDVAQKKEFSKEFGNQNKIAISPGKNMEYKGNDKTVSLHFDIPEKDFGEFAEITLRFTKENNDIKISIMNENNRTVVKVPREIALEFHDYILANNSKFGSTDIQELINLQEDFFAVNPTNGWSLK